MEKMQKERRSNTKSGEDLIDGLPVLRGMFVCPESLMDNLLPPYPDQVLVVQKSSEQQEPLKIGNKRRIYQAGQDKQ